jgi:hypothetical protein
MTQNRKSHWPCDPNSTSTDSAPRPVPADSQYYIQKIFKTKYTQFLRIFSTFIFCRLKLLHTESCRLDCFGSFGSSRPIRRTSRESSLGRDPEFGYPCLVKLATCSPVTWSDKHTNKQLCWWWLNTTLSWASYIQSENNLQRTIIS